MKKTISEKAIIILLLILILAILLILPPQYIRRPSVTGAVVARLYVNPLPITYLCNISIVSGWNLIAVPCSAKNQSVTSILSTISGNFVSIHSYDALNTTDHWKSYNPSLPSWVVNDLADIRTDKGYWLKSLSGAYLAVNGTIQKPATITLYNGWNLVSFISNQSMNISLALSSISGKYSLLSAYNTTTLSFIIYESAVSNNNLSELSPDRGYWINATTNADWVIS